MINLNLPMVGEGFFWQLFEDNGSLVLTLKRRVVVPGTRSSEVEYYRDTVMSNKKAIEDKAVLVANRVRAEILAKDVAKSFTGIYNADPDHVESPPDPPKRPEK